MTRVQTRQTETGRRYDLIDAPRPKGKVTRSDKRCAPDGYVAVDIHLAHSLFDAQIEFTICGNNVNSFHVFGGWHLGYTPSLEAMTDQSFDTLLNNWIFYLDPELGSYPVFYVSTVNLTKLTQVAA